MKKLFYFGIIGWILFEVANVYFIMPMPGSRKMDSIGGAYFLYSWRWIFRILFGLLIIIGFGKAFRGSKILVLLSLLAALGIAYAANFKMAADSMFLQPGSLRLAAAAQSKVDANRPLN